MNKSETTSIWTVAYQFSQCPCDAIVIIAVGNTFTFKIVPEVQGIMRARSATQCDHVLKVTTTDTQAGEREPEINLVMPSLLRRDGAGE